MLIVRNILRDNIPSFTESTSTGTLSIGSEARALLNDEIMLRYKATNSSNMVHKTKMQAGQMRQFLREQAVLEFTVPE